MKNGMIECSVFHSRFVSPNAKTVSRIYDWHMSKISSKHRALNVLLVVGDCILVGLQPILVFMFKARRQKVGEKSLHSVFAFVQAARNNVLVDPQFCHPSTCPIKYLSITLQQFLGGSLLLVYPIFSKPPWRPWLRDLSNPIVTLDSLNLDLGPFRNPKPI